MKKYFFAFIAALSLLSFGAIASPLNVYTKTEIQADRTASVTLQGRTLTESFCIQQADPVASRSICNTRVSKLTAAKAQALRQQFDSAHAEHASHSVRNSLGSELKQNASPGTLWNSQAFLNESQGVSTGKKVSAVEANQDVSTSRSSAPVMQSISLRDSYPLTPQDHSMAIAELVKAVREGLSQAHTDLFKASRDQATFKERLDKTASKAM